MATFTIVAPEAKAKIKIVGVGGAGGNALNTMIEKGLKGVDFIAVNTDAQDLKKSKSYTKLQIGTRSTHGLGAGGEPAVGENSAIEDKVKIAEALDGADMVFITAGMGGGTGTGAAPIVSKVSKEVGSLAIGVVTMPFTFEGPVRNGRAHEGLKAIEKEVDTLIAVPNDRLQEGENLSLIEGFANANNVLYRAVSGITEIINTTGLINVDFADVRSVMSQRGSRAIMGTGFAEGSDRAVKATESAVESPLLGPLSIDGAKGVLLHITAPPDFGSDEIQKACGYVNQRAGDDLNLILGFVPDEEADGQVRVTIIATGIQAPTDPPPDEAPEQSNGQAPEVEESAPQNPPSPEEDLTVPAIIRREKEREDKIRDNSKPRKQGFFFRSKD